MYLLRKKHENTYRVVWSIARAFELLETNQFVAASLLGDRFVSKIEFYRELLIKYGEVLV